MFFIAFGFFTINLNTYFVTVITTERLSGFKHIQLMSSVSPSTYWLSNFVFDYIFFFVIVIARILTIKLIGDHTGFLSLDYHFCEYPCTVPLDEISRPAKSVQVIPIIFYRRFIFFVFNHFRRFHFGFVAFHWKLFAIYLHHDLCD